MPPFFKRWSQIWGPRWNTQFLWDPYFAWKVRWFKTSGSDSVPGFISSTNRALLPSVWAIYPFNPSRLWGLLFWHPARPVSFKEQPVFAAAHTAELPLPPWIFEYPPTAGLFLGTQFGASFFPPQAAFWRPAAFFLEVYGLPEGRRFPGPDFWWFFPPIYSL